MKGQQAGATILHTLLTILYISFFAGLIFHFRAVSSISTGLLLLVGTLFSKKQTGYFFDKKLINPLSVSCFIYVIYTVATLLVKDDIKTATRHIEMKSALLLIPVAVSCCRFLYSDTIRLLMKYYVLLMAAASLYCIIFSGRDYIRSGDSTVLFYHVLVSPLHQHAIYFSLLVFFALLYLLEESRRGNRLFGKNLHLLLLIFFSGILILLSSRLVLVLWGAYLFYFFLFSKVTMKKLLVPGLAFLVIVMLIFITSNPVSNRFREVFRGDLSVVQKENYSPADYFNGLQFRLLQWKFVPEILYKNKSWPTGLGERKGQQQLEQLYISKNMYSGQGGTSGTGYLAYNTHNQLLQSLLTGGIIGAILFLCICLALLYNVWKTKERIFTFAVMAVLLFSATESCFQTQYGLIIFTFFPLFFHYCSVEEA